MDPSAATVKRIAPDREVGPYAFLNDKPQPLRYVKTKREIIYVPAVLYIRFPHASPLQVWN
jgi:hypothetical protein